jgi:arsenate reductase (glutaredoxin)
MQTTNPELIIYYDNESPKARMTLAYAMSLTSKVNRQEIHQVEISETILRQLLSRLNVSPKEILNKAHSYYKEVIKGREFTDAEWLCILRKNPTLFKCPIASYRNHTILCETPTDIFKLLRA